MNPEDHFFKFRTRLVYANFQYAMNAAIQYKKEGEVTSLVDLGGGKWGLSLFDRLAPAHARILYNDIVNPAF